jgi:hypothetical protein
LQSQQHDILQSQKHFTTTIITTTTTTINKNNNPQIFLKKTHFTHINQKTTMTLESQQQQGGVSQCGLAIYIKKYLRAKEELWKLKYFTMQNYNLQKIL